jgi:hypothetical protein
MLLQHEIVFGETVLLQEIFTDNLGGFKSDLNNDKIQCAIWTI